ncbi:duf498 domain protein [Moniliophthora roreri MCA 2997]|uniref:NADH dehydrogenase [ubiquinone] 1 alpha subcomplex assembly factor 3 n=1 Tax=Moniliophthora roreri (strain MCA 2997) TaxID=1381753 RepID=V2WXE1_MONRO|nr:duf498 domain protein [Moniliophthora roreri MCA 2997]KAI3607549.1 duf498 domain protein [Moniliophthora roreri]
MLASVALRNIRRLAGSPTFRNLSKCSVLTRTLPKTAHFHTGSITRNGPRREPFINILADSDLPPPPVQVSSITSNGIHLTDGLVIPSACIFLEGKVFLWDVPVLNVSKGWEGWVKDMFEVFEVVSPRPEILLLGTGKTLVQPPPFVREYLNSLGIQVDVLDTRNACSYYNLLSEEGRRVAAALLPLTPRAWTRSQIPLKK